MQPSLYFYDLETSGINPKTSRIMQFAGQRTDLDLQPIGAADNLLLKITNDILPEPEAILITGITPQQTLAEGISEAEFLKYFYEHIALPGTIFVGFNNIRFDDEFIRYLNYRNFYDAYQWHWQDGKSRWDLLDVSRMTRALRPDGIKWPFAPNGKASNRLELLASVNKLTHDKAHDALSDVEATIAVTQLIKQQQPKLFNYLLSMRDKKNVESLVTKPAPFVYTSGRYSSEGDKTTVAVTIADHPTQKGAVLVYDLQTNPAKYVKMSQDKLAEKMAKFVTDENEERFPVKVLQFNHSPAVAPLSVLDEPSQKRLKIDLNKINDHLKTLLSHSDFAENLREAFIKKEKLRQSSFVIDVSDVDSQLYDGFFGPADQDKMRLVRLAGQEDLADLQPEFNDARLEKLLLLYKARQYPLSLNEQEQKQWESYRQQKLIDPKKGLLNSYFAKLDELSQRKSVSDKQRYLLEELKLYGESLLPYSS